MFMSRKYEKQYKFLSNYQLFVIILFYFQEIKCLKIFTTCKRPTTEEVDPTALTGLRISPKTPRS